MKLWLAITAALAIIGASDVRAQTQGQSDDYVCNHGDQAESRTQEACARLRGTASEDVDTAAPAARPARPRHTAQAAPAAPPAPVAASKLSGDGQSLAADGRYDAPASNTAAAQTSAPAAGLAPAAAQASAQTPISAPAAAVPAPTPSGRGMSMLTIGGAVSVALGAILAVIAAVIFLTGKSGASSRASGA